MGKDSTGRLCGDGGGCWAAPCLEAKRRASRRALRHDPGSAVRLDSGDLGGEPWLGYSQSTPYFRFSTSFHVCTTTHVVLLGHLCWPCGLVSMPRSVCWRNPSVAYSPSLPSFQGWGRRRRRRRRSQGSLPGRLLLASRSILPTLAPSPSWLDLPTACTISRQFQFCRVL